MWWDIRKLVEPVETLVLEYPGYKTGVILGGITLEYESTMVRLVKEYFYMMTISLANKIYGWY